MTNPLVVICRVVQLVTETKLDLVSYVHCCTQHRLIFTRFRLRLRRPLRSAIKKPAFLNVHRLKDLEVREKYAESLADKLSTISEIGDVNAA